MSTNNSNKITEDFIFEGFFSEYLPPSFNIKNNFNPCDIDLSNSIDLVEPVRFNMSRFSEDGKRRIIFVPEFSSYISTVKFMKENNLIDDLIETSKDKHSFSPLIHSNNSISRHETDYNFGVSIDSFDKEVFVSNYIPNVVEKICRAKGAKGILSLDISNFYPSVYTHLIPSIKLGFEDAEIQYKAQKADNTNPIISEDYRMYVKLDEHIRNMNVGRTNGLLPGTLISQFIAEALLARIDMEIDKYGINFTRYVDDYEIFIYNENDISKIQNIVASCLSKYFLSLNNEKTKYVSFPYYVVENLGKLYSDYTGSKPDNENIMKLFNSFFELEKSGTKGAIRFLVKSINESFKAPNEELLSAYLFNILVNDSRSLVKVCELLIKRKNSMNFSTEDVELIEKLLAYHIDANNHLETIWLLYLRNKISTKKAPAKLMNKIAKSNNDLAKIILIEEYGSKLSNYTKNIIIDGASSWLLCYQLFYHNYINKAVFSQKSNIKKNVAFYATLKRKHFSFYNYNL